MRMMIAATAAAMVFGAWSAARVDAQTTASNTQPQMSDAERRKAVRAELARRGVSPRIVNGQPARPNEMPWQAALVVRPDAGGTIDVNALQCGATFIRPNILMTAAHCVENRFIGSLKDWAVVSGVNRLGDQGMITYDITDVVIHPRYARVGDQIAGGLDYDFALLRIAQNYTGPTVDILSAEENNRINVGTTAQVSGWGATSQGGDSSADLMKVDVRIVSRADCNDANSYKGLISSRMLCAGFKEGSQPVDSCQGDSGGPLTAAIGPNGTRRLIGVVSWGHGCAQRNKHGVYGRIHAVRNWVNGAIDLLSTVD